MPNHLVARATKTTSALTVERSKDLLRKRDELSCAQQRHPRVAIVALGLRLVAILLEHRLRVAVPAHLGSSFFMSLQPPFQAILMTQQRGKLLARLSQTPLLRKARRVDLRLQLLGQTRPVHPSNLRLPPDEVRSRLPRVCETRAVRVGDASLYDLVRVVREVIPQVSLLAPVACQSLRRVLDVALVDRHWRRRQLRGGSWQGQDLARHLAQQLDQHLAHAPGRELCRLACAAGEDLSRGPCRGDAFGSCRHPR